MRNTIRTIPQRLVTSKTDSNETSNKTTTFTLAVCFLSPDSPSRTNPFLIFQFFPHFSVSDRPYYHAAPLILIAPNQ